MKKRADFALVGGDLRFVRLAGLLRADGLTVTAHALGGHPVPAAAEALPEALRTARAVILPIPLTDGAEGLFAPLADAAPRAAAVLDAIPPGTPTFAGRIPPALQNRAAARGLRLYDLLENEGFAVRNAVPTAEGALQLAMEALPTTLCGLDCLVLGWGRIGSCLARRLQALGARVTVSARRDRDFAALESAGLPHLDTRALAGRLAPFALVFNTVPAPVLTAPLLAELPPQAVVIDLASRPGGVDRSAAEKRGLHCIHALSLPGKTAPLSAARAIRDTVFAILREEEPL